LNLAGPRPKGKEKGNFKRKRKFKRQAGENFIKGEYVANWVIEKRLEVLGGDGGKAWRRGGQIFSLKIEGGGGGELGGLVPAYTGSMRSVWLALLCGGRVGLEDGSSCRVLNRQGVKPK